MIRYHQQGKIIIMIQLWKVKPALPLTDTICLGFTVITLTSQVFLDNLTSCFLKSETTFQHPPQHALKVSR